GRALSQSLAADGHDVCLLTRGAGDRTFKTAQWTPDGESGPWASVIDGADAVVNLAGESIAAKRWTAAQKQRILDSRVQATRSLGRAMHRPAFMPAPAFALRLLLGEMADALVLSGPRAVPSRAERGGFAFTYQTVDAALQAIFVRA